VAVMSELLLGEVHTPSCQCHLDLVLSSYRVALISSQRLKECYVSQEDNQLRETNRMILSRFVEAGLTLENIL